MLLVDSRVVEWEVGCKMGFQTVGVVVCLVALVVIVNDDENSLVGEDFTTSLEQEDKVLPSLLS
jgi:hypothetical protein